MVNIFSGVIGTELLYDTVSEKWTNSGSPQHGKIPGRFTCFPTQRQRSTCQVLFILSTYWVRGEEKW